MTYQSHSLDEPGMVDSAKRLDRLKIPKDLTGKTLLDVGCNEGFFSNVAADRGAKVTGIDRDLRSIEFAKKRYQNQSIEFQHRHWSSIPDGPFDYALWTSAMHYELDPKSVLDEIHRHLKPGGLLILECGFAQSHKKEMVPLQRHDGTCWYPSRRFLEETLLSSFAWREVARPEFIGTDPAPRSVFHCRKRMPTVVLVRGNTHAGKSSLASTLYESATKVVSLDLLVHRIFSAKYHHTDLEKYVLRTNTGYNLTSLYDGIDSNGLTDEWANLLSKMIAASDQVVVIEGYMTDAQRDAIRISLNGRAKVWDAIPM